MPLTLLLHYYCVWEWNEKHAETEVYLPVIVSLAQVVPSCHVILRGVMRLVDSPVASERNTK